MSGKALVLDASTAILLAKVDLLRCVAARSDVWMAESAVREATVKDTDDARMIAALIQERFIKPMPVAEGSQRIGRDFRLGAGETDTIALAQKHGAVCGTDDGPAIRCCRVLGIPFTSAIALLARLAEARAVSPELAAEILDQLARFGRYEPRIIEDIAMRIRHSKDKHKGATS
jgi:predicted nucleic acid-binding protein